MKKFQKISPKLGQNQLKLKKIAKKLGNISDFGQNLVKNVKTIMESVHLKYKDFSVPLTVDYGAGENWGQAHQA